MQFCSILTTKSSLNVVMFLTSTLHAQHASCAECLIQGNIYAKVHCSKMLKKVIKVLAFNRKTIKCYITRINIYIDKLCLIKGGQVVFTTQDKCNVVEARGKHGSEL